jgi:hypothetical protein
MLSCFILSVPFGFFDRRARFQMIVELQILQKCDLEFVSFQYPLHSSSLILTIPPLEVGRPPSTLFAFGGSSSGLYRLPRLRSAS